MGEFIKLNAADGHTLSAYEARPAGKPRGGLVIVQEIFGVTEHIRNVADRYAALGYHAIAPAIFDRVEPNFEVNYDPDGVAAGRANAQKLTREQMLTDIGAATSALGGSGKVAVVGYCLGGSLAFFSAVSIPSVSAAVGYYGGQILQAPEAKPKVPVMLHFGEKDAGIPLEGVEKVKAAQDPAMVEIFVYPDAPHAFNRDGSPAYQEAAAKLALERTLAFLDKHIG